MLFTLPRILKERWVDYPNEVNGDRFDKYGDAKN